MLTNADALRVDVSGIDINELASLIHLVGKHSTFVQSILHYIVRVKSRPAGRLELHDQELKLDDI